MALPKIDIPTYEIELPISKKKIKYRPFLVKEQRNLLMAIESDETSTIQQNIKDILYNCTLTEGIDIDSLPILDIEYYFINLRAKSVGEVVDSNYRCNNEVDGNLCGNTMKAKINLLEIKPDLSNLVNPEIQLTPQLIIKMKYPEFGNVKQSLNMDNITDITFNMIANSVEYIYDGEQFYYATEAAPGEMLEFIEQLNQEQFDKVENFFNNLPRMTKNVQMKCGKCGFDHTIEVEGLENFFG
jgi:hypothetical protein